MIKEDKAELDLWVARRDDWQEDLDSSLQQLAAEKDEGIRALVRGDIAHAKKILGPIDQLLEKSGYGG